MTANRDPDEDLDQVSEDGSEEALGDDTYAPPRLTPVQEGFQVDLPFVSFRVGRSSGGLWTGAPLADDAYERARQRVHARLSFYRHLTIYAAVIAAIFFIDIVTGGGLSVVTLWIAGIWGAVLVWQAFNAFVFPSVFSEETEEKMIQEELRRQRDR